VIRPKPTRGILVGLVLQAAGIAIAVPLDPDQGGERRLGILLPLYAPIIAGVAMVVVFAAALARQADAPRARVGTWVLIAGSALELLSLVFYITESSRGIKSDTDDALLGLAIPLVLVGIVLIWARRPGGLRGVLAPPPHGPGRRQTFVRQLPAGALLGVFYGVISFAVYDSVVVAAIKAIIFAMSFTALRTALELRGRHGQGSGDPR
jgi:hypothetical protein